MRILLVGSGGREHALAQALAASPTCRELHCAPGNPGIARVATCHDVAVDDVGGLVALAHHLEAGLVVIGPELPLVLGLGDALRRARIPVFGPSSGAALRRGLEGVLEEADAGRGRTDRALLDVHRQSTRRCAPSTSSAAPASSRPTGSRPARASRSAPIAPRRQAAVEACLVGGAFGDAGRTVVSRSCSSATRSRCSRSATARRRVPLAAAQDFKRVGDGDTGPNTGGMGAYSPVPWFDDAADGRRRAARARAAAGRARAPRHPVLGLPLRRPHAHGRRAAGARVQRALRRSGDAGAGRAPRRRPRRRARGDRARAPDEVALGVGDEAAVTLVLAAPGYPEAHAHRPADRGHRGGRGARRA